MKRLIIISILMCAWLGAMAQTKQFCIAKDGKAATIIVDENDWEGVIRAANNLGDDVRKVTGVEAPVVESNSLTSHLLPLTSIYVGTIGKSKAIDRLIKQKKLDIKPIKGRWAEETRHKAYQGSLGGVCHRCCGWQLSHCRQRQKGHHLRHLRDFAPHRCVALVLDG